MGIDLAPEALLEDGVGDCDTDGGEEVLDEDEDGVCNCYLPGFKVALDRNDSLTNGQNLRAGTVEKQRGMDLNLRLAFLSLGRP